MQGYESYKPSGAAWLGNVPSHWDVQPLRAVTSLKSDKNRPDLPVLSVYREYGVILKDSRDDNHNATSLDTSNYKVVKPGDLVVNKMKAWQGSMGVSAHDGIVSPAYITCTTKADRVRPEYLHYLLRSSPLIGVYNSLSYGVRVGQWDMHYEDFKQIPIPLPPKDEQDRIVAFLDQKTAEIDAAIAKKERLIELLQEQRDVRVNQLVTRGLGVTKDFRETGIGILSHIPVDWKITLVRRIVKDHRQGFYTTDEYVDSGVKLARITDIAEFEIDYSNMPFVKISSNDEKLFSLKIDDFLFGRTGAGVGKFARVQEIERAVFASYLIRFSFDQNVVSPDFLWFYFKSKFFLTGLFESTHGGANQNIHAENIKQQYIAIPPPHEQADICKELTAYFNKVDSLIKNELQSVAQLHELKKTLVAHMVVGKIKA